jgi:hypothetical protein
VGGKGRRESGRMRRETATSFNISCNATPARLIALVANTRPVPMEAPCWSARHCVYRGDHRCMRWVNIMLTVSQRSIGTARHSIVAYTAG